jgi:hypothetical protein
MVSPLGHYVSNKGETQHVHNNSLTVGTYNV